MTLTQIRWLAVGLLIFMLSLSYLFPSEGRTLGASAEWHNGDYRFAGGTEPQGLGFAALVIGLYVLLMYAEPAKLGKPLPGVFRRFAAFWIDFVLAMTSLAPVLGILLTVSEWRRTGVFRWNFARDTYARGDALLAMLSFLAASGALLLYYSVPLTRRKPSLGACIVGYMIVPENGDTMPLGRAVLRNLLAFVAVSGWCVTPFIVRDRKNGKLWFDRIFGTQAMLLN
jgi:uncharacterized RDD family membrane protein YckC